MHILNPAAMRFKIYAVSFKNILSQRMKEPKPRRPHGRWTYYILHEDMLWPCPVRWEWETGYGGWLPFYYSPTFEFVAGDPDKALKIVKGKAVPLRNALRNSLI